MKKRIIYTLCFLAILIIEIVIGIYAHDDIIRPFVGDILVVVLIYCFIRIFIPRSLRWLPAYVFTFACFVEILQYFQFADIMGLSKNGLARIVLGATFDWGDILCYAIGCLILLLVEYIERRIVRRRREKQSLIGYKNRTHWYL